jgi:DNA repair protein RecN (Recombination protein N)
MMIRLHIENLALIERADLEPAAGLNVVSGETGAGKTMLAAAIGLLAGAQTPAAVVGPHGDEAYVEAEFEIPDGLLDEPDLAAVRDLRPQGEETLVVARRLFASGRSRALVWGRSCARADLEALGEHLLEVSSQHEARRLAQPSTQLALLDAHAANAARLVDMATAWAGLRNARTALESAREHTRAALSRRAELEELAERVGEAAVQPRERESLEVERARLRHLDELTAAAAGAADLINPDEGDGALSLSGRAAELLADVERYEPGLAAVGGELREAALRLQESAIELRAYLTELDADPGRLDQVEGRLQLFADLEHRFGHPLDELVELAAAAREALDGLDASGEAIERLEAEEAAALERATGCAAALTAARTESAEPFGRAIEAELADLGMSDARVSASITEADLGARGSDRVELRLAANPGLPAGPVATIASGGELSRIALAIRVAARAHGGPGTLLLDEVDAGVGGLTARAVGEKLLRLAETAQVLCITHLPQIAGLAEAHFRVEKRSGEPTATTIERLAGGEVVEEITRMLGGEGAAARRHAKALRAG